MQAAGYKVFLISNQFRLGSWDGPVNILYTGLDRKEYIQEQSPGAKDGAILDKLQKYMTETDGPVLIIVHLIGSHGSYDERYPAEFIRKLVSANDDVNIQHGMIRTADGSFAFAAIG